MSDEEIQREIEDMEEDMKLLPNGNKGCQELINQMKKLLK